MSIHTIISESDELPYSIEVLESTKEILITLFDEHTQETHNAITFKLKHEGMNTFIGYLREARSLLDDLENCESTRDEELTPYERDKKVGK